MTSAASISCLAAAGFLFGAGSAFGGAHPETSRGAPAPGWSGVYVGAHLGHVFSRFGAGDDRVGIRSADGDVFPAPDALQIDGPTGGLQAGYRFETAFGGRNVVIGAELSYEAGNADDRFDTGGLRASDELGSLVGLRVKAGALDASGTTLLYGSIGAAYGEFNYVVDGRRMDFDDPYDDTALTVGFGIETKLSDRVSVFGEYESRMFGRTKLTDAAGFSTQATPEHAVVKIGLNYAF